MSYLLSMHRYSNEKYKENTLEVQKNTREWFIQHLAAAYKGEGGMWGGFKGKVQEISNIAYFLTWMVDVQMCILLSFFKLDIHSL